MVRDPVSDFESRAFNRRELRSGLVLTDVARGTLRAGIESTRPKHGSPTAIRRFFAPTFSLRSRRACCPLSVRSHFDSLLRQGNLGREIQMWWSDGYDPELSPAQPRQIRARSFAPGSFRSV